MGEPKIHLKHPARNAPLCGHWINPERRPALLTTDPQRVTCRGCLRAMERAQ